MGERREGLDGEGGREEKKMREAEVNSRAHEGRTEEGNGPRGGKGRGMAEGKERYFAIVGPVMYMDMRCLNFICMRTCFCALIFLQADS